VRGNGDFVRGNGDFSSPRVPLRGGTAFFAGNPNMNINFSVRGMCKKTVAIDAIRRQSYRTDTAGNGQSLPRDRIQHKAAQVNTIRFCNL
jgi:hypothetical protein